ncbi:MAG: hypothetical protein KGZ82_14630 [Bacteroidales bacterium]|nr:hypothetical protein [Bacteroidales bacterium]
MLRIFPPVLIFLALLCLIQPKHASSQVDTLMYLEDQQRFQPEKLIDIEHLSAELDIDPYATLVKGKANFLFRQIRQNVDSAVFSTPGFTIKALDIDHHKADYYRKGDLLVIALPAQTKNAASHEISIQYEVKPEKELYFIGWNDPTGRKRKQVWAHRPFYWLPYADDRLTVDMKVTFDYRYKVFSNGIRESVTDNLNGTKTWHYKMYHNHPFFSTALVIGDYMWRDMTSPRGLPLELWYYPDRSGNVDATYAYMKEMVNFCEKEFGMPYPYEVYREAPVVDYLYGAMETTTSTIFGDYMHIDPRAYWERNYINVNAHELTHQWFGNYISHLRGKDVWLTESFATYYAKLFEKTIFGVDHYEWERTKELKRVLDASEKDDFAIGHSQGGVDRWYPKGSLVLDMLRDHLGDEDFKRSVSTYLKMHPYSEVWTADFMRAIQLTTGSSMDWFFDQWIERGGEPYYGITYQTDGDSLRLFVKQLQPINKIRPAFRVHLTFEIWYNNGHKSVFNLLNDKAEQSYALPIDFQGNPDFLLFDPGARMIKKVKFDREPVQLLNQFRLATNMIDRYDALMALKEVPLDVKRSTLEKQYYRENYHLIKSEIVNQLSVDENKKSEKVIYDALDDSEVYVRRAAITALQAHHKISRGQARKMLSDESYSNIKLSLEKLVLLDPDNTANFLKMTADEVGFPGLNIRITWLRLAIEYGQEDRLKELIDYSSPSFDFLTRMNAMEALGALKYINGKVAANLVEAADHWNFRLQPVAFKVLKQFYAENRNKLFIEEAIDNQFTNRKKADNLLEKLRAAD